MGGELSSVNTINKVEHGPGKGNNPYARKFNICKVVDEVLSKVSRFARVAQSILGGGQWHRTDRRSTRIPDQLSSGSIDSRLARTLGSDQATGPTIWRSTIPS